MYINNAGCIVAQLSPCLHRTPLQIINSMHSVQCYSVQVVRHSRVLWILQDLSNGMSIMYETAFLCGFKKYDCLAYSKAGLSVWRPDNCIQSAAPNFILFHHFFPNPFAHQLS